MFNLYDSSSFEERNRGARNVLASTGQPLRRGMILVALKDVQHKPWQGRGFGRKKARGLF